VLNCRPRRIRNDVGSESWLILFMCVCFCRSKSTLDKMTQYHVILRVHSKSHLLDIAVDETWSPYLATVLEAARDCVDMSPVKL
jgi:hypothetical protein